MWWSWIVSRRGRGVRKSYSKRFLYLPAQNEVECDPPSQHHNYELNTSLVLRRSTALAPAGGLPTTPLKANRVSKSRKIACRVCTSELWPAFWLFTLWGLGKDSRREEKAELQFLRRGNTLDFIYFK